MQKQKLTSTDIIHGKKFSSMWNVIYLTGQCGRHFLRVEWNEEEVQPIPWPGDW